MPTLGRKLARRLSAAAVLTLVPIAASAQNPSGPRSQGPMTVERVQSGWLIAPEVKVTDFDHRTSELVGAQGGWLADQTFFIGAGGYWLAADRSQDRQLAYGGLVIGILPRTEGAVGFGATALIGGGRATTLRTVTIVPDFDPRLLGSRDPDLIVRPVQTTARVRSDFFVAEPEASLIFNLSKRIHLAAGVSYRFAGENRGPHDALSGVAGSLALQIGR